MAGQARQQAVLGTSDALQVTDGSRQSTIASIGTGVQIEAYKRIRDQFLDLQYRGQNTNLGDWKARAATLDQAEGALQEPGENGINQQLAEFWNAWSDLANANGEDVVETFEAALCLLAVSLDPLRHEVEAGLNVVERWNEANDFIRYGRQGLFTTNSREQQEISALCLQLVQNCLMLINSILVEQTVAHHQLLEQFSGDDRRALSALFYEHVNPYGLFELDVTRPSFLEVA